MPGPIDKRAFVGAWVAKAESDFRALMALAAVDKDISTEAVCFHAQQCVEKYLKALLTEYDVEFGRSHDIEQLVRAVPSQFEIPLNAGEQALLTYYAVETRYPELDDPPSLDDARGAKSLAEKVRMAVRGQLGL